MTCIKNNGITTMKKHVESNHSALLKILLKEATNLASRSSLDCDPNKKRPHVSSSIISNFFLITSKFKKDDATQVVFLEDLMLFMIKGFMFMRIVESIWLQRLVYRLCPQLIFPPKKTR
jgi:hypothetical protein